MGWAERIVGRKKQDGGFASSYFALPLPIFVQFCYSWVGAFICNFSQIKTEKHPQKWAIASKSKISRKLPILFRMVFSLNLPGNCKSYRPVLWAFGPFAWPLCSVIEVGAYGPSLLPREESQAKRAEGPLVLPILSAQEGPLISLAKSYGPSGHTLLDWSLKSA